MIDRWNISYSNWKRFRIAQHEVSKFISFKTENIEILKENSFVFHNLKRRKISENESETHS
jgi:hypothetical protein